MESKNFNEFCSTICDGQPCPNYIKWNFGYGDCESCTLCGESMDIEEYPSDCLFIDEIKKYESENK